MSLPRRAYDNIETFRIGKTDIKCENNVSLLGINIDFMLKFDDHVTEICKKASVKYFTDRSKAVLLLWIFYVFVLFCVCYVLCASVYMCFVVTCWERADLLALDCGVFCEFVTFPLVSWVRCGT